MKTVKENTTKVKDTSKFQDLKAVKSISSIALIRDGKPVGSVNLHYSDNPAGSVVTARVYLHGSFIDSKLQYLVGVGKAGGYGYDKSSSAIYEALRNMQQIVSTKGGIKQWTYNVYDLTDDIKVEPGRGNEREAFEEAGFVWYQTI